MLIDFHTHTFPEKIAEKTVEILLSNVEKMGMAESVAYSDATVV